MSTPEVRPEMGIIEMLKNVKQLAEKIDNIKYICFEEITADEEHDNIRPNVKCFIGKLLDANEYSELYSNVKKIVDFYYSVKSMIRKDIHVTDIAVVSENNEIVIMLQLEEDVYDEYGEYIGRDRWYVRLDKIVNNVRKMLEECEETMSKIENIVKEITKR